MRRGGITEQQRGAADRTAAGQFAWLLWVPAVVVVAVLGYLRWHHATGHPIGVDFGYSLSAAHEIAAGRSPYLIKQYVYPPPLALALVPFVHASAATLWKVWLAVVLLAAVGGAAAFGSLVRGPRARWLRPVAFAVCGASLLYDRYYPMSQEVVLGQADTIVLVLLVLAATATGRARARGVWIGLAGLVKVWPWVTVVAVAQPGTRRRRRTIVWTVGVALLAPLSALAFGWSGFFRNSFDARQQHLVSDSVWDIPRLLFTRSTMARPVTDSAGLQVVLTLALVALVVTLLVIALRTPARGALGPWNSLFCVILLLPVAHRQYALLVLPVAWWWALRSVTDVRQRRLAAGVTAVLVLWWLDQTVSWPYNGSSDHITALHYCVPFAADLVAAAASIVGARCLAADSEGVREGPEA